MLVLPKTWIQSEISEKNIFQDLFSLNGEVFRQQPGRKTLRFQKNNENYFIKIHKGVGWREIFKNLFQLRLPIVGAKNEWQALQALKQLNIPTLELVGYGSRGVNPATRHSFVITKELTQVTSLETFTKDWRISPPAFKIKLNLIKNLAQIARTLHINGINHRDFYLCHFLIKTDVPLHQACEQLYLIDLHRAQIRQHTPKRWIIKDLAGLYFSSLHFDLTRNDKLRFMKYYKGTLRQTLRSDNSIWKKVKTKAQKLFVKHTRQISQKLKNIKIIYNVQFNTPEFVNFFKNINILFNEKSQKILKNGDTTTVVLVELGQKKWVVKRYNMLSLWHRLSKTFVKSRAQRCWEMAWQLIALKIPTPLPLCYIETKRFGFPISAYFMSEYIEGEHALNYFQANASKMRVQSLIKYLAQMSKNKISHGDLKATNIIVSANDFYFIDLDAMHKHKNARLFYSAQQKDYARFMKNWEKLPQLKRMFSDLGFSND